MSLLFGNIERAIPSRLLGGGPVSLLGQTVPFAWVYAGGVSILMLLGVYIYLYRSRIGRQTRAIMAQREEAVSVGIDIHRVSAIAFGVGTGLAAVAGVFAPFMLGSFTPSMGVPLDLTAFAVIVIGSLGNPLGALFVDRRTARRRQQELYALFPILAEKRRQASGSLSGGQRKMLGIAKALAAEPKLLVMDEPSAGLSPLLVSTVIQSLDACRAGGLSLLIAEQNVKFLELGDRVFTMEGGRITFGGTPAAIQADDGLRRAYFGLGV